MTFFINFEYLCIYNFFKICYSIFKQKIKMNILVIGGCGYIGSVLCEKLFDQGHKVTILDSEIFGNFLDKKALSLDSINFSFNFPLIFSTFS